MTLQNIFDNIQYGEDYTKNKAIKESINRSYDKDIDIFYASKKIKELSGKIVMTEGEEQKVNRLISKLTIIEDRMEANKPMTASYKKMQGAAIASDCEGIISEATKSKKTDSNKLDVFGKMVADAKYFAKIYIDDSICIKEGNNPLVNKSISEESALLEEVIEN